VKLSNTIGLLAVVAANICLAKARATEPVHDLVLNVSEHVTMKLTLIPAGSFMMGSPVTEPTRLKNEGPQHQVTLTKPFYLGIYDVTQEQYEAVEANNPSLNKGPDIPVTKLSWNDITDFCQKLSQKTGKVVRLPTEAEWEYAARAGTQTSFSFGDDMRQFADYGWTRPSSNAIISHPVGQKKPNQWGLYDMYGNVAQPCSDWDGAYTPESAVDPKGPATGKWHVVRGGSCACVPQNCRAASRGVFRYPQGNDHVFGIRVVSEAK
jgi:formylglycine-generating enzyme required for sulfatase activity